MSDKQDETPEIEQERDITPVSKSGSELKKAELKKKIGLGCGIAFLSLIGYQNYVKEQPEKVEAVTKAPREIRSSGELEAVDFPQNKPVEIVETPTVEKIQPTGPIEQARLEEVKPTGPSEAEILFESSKVAPLLAFGGGRKSTSTETSNNNGSLFGASGEAANGTPREGLSSRLQVTQLDTAYAGVIKEPHLTVTKGTFIPCSLVPALESTQAGQVTCTVNSNVYSSTGAVVLMEKGTKIVGEYQGGLERGTKRIFVIWTRAETPYGVIVNLDSPASDSLGRSGFDGDIDKQFWTRFGGAIMLSIIDDGLAIFANNSNSDNLSNTTQGISNIADTELQSTINVPYILSKNQGEEVGVMLARDLDFSTVYSLTLK